MRLPSARRFGRPVRASTMLSARWRRSEATSGLRYAAVMITRARAEDPELGPAPALEPGAAEHDDQQHSGPEDWDPPASASEERRHRAEAADDRHESRGVDTLLHVEQPLTMAGGRAQPRGMTEH